MKWLDCWTVLRKINEKSSYREMKFRIKRQMKRTSEMEVQERRKRKTKVEEAELHKLSGTYQRRDNQNMNFRTGQIERIIDRHSDPR